MAAVTGTRYLGLLPGKKFFAKMLDKKGRRE
jgi:hypothetical protein